MKEVKAMNNFYGISFERDLDAYARMLAQAEEKKRLLGSKYLLDKPVEKKNGIQRSKQSKSSDS